MLHWISICGGLLIMMAHPARIRFEFAREQLKNSHGDTGRPSVDPELLLRILLLGISTASRMSSKLVEELRMHLAWRWFTGLSFDQETPHHSRSPRTDTGGFKRRSCSSSCSNTSYGSVWKSDWWGTSSYPWMAA